jgi:WD40 repeat protein
MHIFLLYFQYRRVSSHLASNIKISHHLFANSRDGKFLFSAGHWDSSFQISSINGALVNTVDIIYGHHDIVTCICMSEDGKTLVTGSRDTTAIAWELSNIAGEINLHQETRRVFYGHDEEVT